MPSDLRDSEKGLHCRTYGECAPLLFLRQGLPVCSSDCPGTHAVDEVGLKLELCLPLIPRHLPLLILVVGCGFLVWVLFGGVGGGVLFSFCSRGQFELMIFMWWPLKCWAHSTGIAIIHSHSH